MIRLVTLYGGTVLAGACVLGMIVLAAGKIMSDRKKGLPVSCSAGCGQCPKTGCATECATAPDAARNTAPKPKTRAQGK